MLEIIGRGEYEGIKPGKVYRIRHHLGRDPQTGKYIRSPKKTVYCTKKQAWDELQKYKQELIDEDEARRHPPKREIGKIGLCGLVLALCTLLGFTGWHFLPVVTGK